MKNLHSLVVLRFLIAFIFLTHGAHRIYAGTVDDFGEKFLGAVVGLGVLGLPTAWLITLMEFVCAALLVANFAVRWAALWLMFVIIMGIFLVHLPNGWFVVGAGSNGIEYSVLILAALLAVAFPNGFEKQKL
jgi:putative oxidoreductase